MLRLIVIALLAPLVLASVTLAAESPAGLFTTTVNLMPDTIKQAPEWLTSIVSPAMPNPKVDLQYPESGTPAHGNCIEPCRMAGFWNTGIPQFWSEAIILPVQGTSGLLTDPRDQGPDGDPDISKPGPDLGDYPNSAFTLKKGRIQLEIAPATFRTKNGDNSSGYAAPFLFRYGVTDDVEFRVMGTGLTSEFSPDQVTGFSPVVLDTKIHMWEARIEYLVPAASLEASIQTELGSESFRGGYQPSLNLNMDFPFTDSTNVEITLGYSSNLTTVDFHELIPGGTTNQILFDENIYVFQFQWAVEQEITEKITGFIHGYVNRPIGVDMDGGIVVGAGLFYKVSQKLMLFGSANPGLNETAAPLVMQLGAAYAL